MSTKPLIVVALAIIAMQAIRPARENPPVDPVKTLFASHRVPPAVVSSLMRACRDCHSNETVWPWYTNIAPVSWWIAHHVEEGREELSFSTWADQPIEQRARKLAQLCRAVDGRDMPPSSYVVGHPDAALSGDDRRAICAWTKAEIDAIEAAPKPLALTGPVH